jgi:uncharacterized membrane protein
MSADIAITVALVVIAVPLFAFGRWGWARAADLAGPRGRSRVAVIRRGAMACMVVAVLCAGAAIGGLVRSLL